MMRRGRRRGRDERPPNWTDETVALPDAGWSAYQAAYHADVAAYWDDEFPPPGAAAERRQTRVKRTQSHALLALSLAVFVTVAALVGFELGFARPDDGAPPAQRARAAQTPFPTAVGKLLTTKPRTPTPRATVTSAATAARAASSETATVAPAVPDGPGIARLQIPSIGVDAAVSVKGTDEHNAMLPPDGPWDVAWYDFTARPGAGGNAVFAGHLDYVDVGPAVFWDLGSLGEGAAISVVLEDGTRYEYQVTAVATFNDADAPVDDILAPTAVDSVTLITCAGAFDDATRSYSDRLVVRAERIPDETP